MSEAQVTAYFYYWGDNMSHKANHWLANHSLHKGRGTGDLGYRLLIRLYPLHRGNPHPAGNMGTIGQSNSECALCLNTLSSLLRCHNVYRIKATTDSPATASIDDGIHWMGSGKKPSNDGHMDTVSRQEAQGKVGLRYVWSLFLLIPAPWWVFWTRLGSTIKNMDILI